MPRLVRNAVLAIALMYSLTAASLASNAPVPVAPIPTPLTTAKKVFIANGVGQTGLPQAAVIYDDFYAQAKNWGRYELVSNPADADIILQLSVPVKYNGTLNTIDFRLEARDPKSNVLIWTTSVTPRAAMTASGIRKDIVDTNTKLIDLFASQIGAAPLPKPAPKSPAKAPAAPADHSIF